MGIFFLLSWAARYVAGWGAYDEERLRNLQDPINLGQYLLKCQLLVQNSSRTGSPRCSPSAAWRFTRSSCGTEAPHKASQ
jgi:hypothetical protein